jgi:hypothetical protein
MSDLTTPAAMTGKGPWRLLILDTSDPEDARWILATVAVPTDVRGAVMEPSGRRYTDWPQAAEWVRRQVGRQVQLTPIAAIVWRVSEGYGD